MKGIVLRNIFTHLVGLSYSSVVSVFVLSWAVLDSLLFALGLVSVLAICLAKYTSWSQLSPAAIFFPQATPLSKQLLSELVQKMNTALIYSKSI